MTTDPSRWRGTVNDERRNVALRWLLVCLVLLGLVTMHHVVNDHTEHIDHIPASEHTSAAAHPVAPEHHSPSPGHDDSSALTHLCLAVLVGSIVLVLAHRILRRATDLAAGLRLPALRTGDDRAPPSPSGVRTGFAYELCVLRL
ncbi:DUF6153 family protein [Saccharomonospora xinjiangensis]|uniref:DUF6153 family protein n=1 Tax=Saccharomonospora xinjiangensis TaxID=75294 RepID=UPI001FFDC09C|nr:DUF6153 family protein [Saccharomonospora xinjiangensis]